MVSQFMHALNEEHTNAVVRILRYLKGIPGKRLLFSKTSNLDVEAYTNADWAGCMSDMRSTSKYRTFVGDNLVTWRSKKQSIMTRSCAKAI